MRRFTWVLVPMVLLLAACASGGGWQGAPRNDPAACVTYCQNAYQRCNANPRSYGDCGEANRNNQCDKITNPELRGACQTSQAFCQNRSAASVCGERLNSCMNSCN
ncbi:hypothetical protein [uncultured Stenotrophomonas sp.]|uniref:hypothetical protein n=1 Tax=uncultured Stenotrophomonas sp. TaxID=165438 RepID=UPI0025ED6720|nr:hypothetical protein [uncultured Stenotrophomonas sp.]